MVKIVAENAFNGMVGTLEVEESGVVVVRLTFSDELEFTYRGRTEDIEVVELAS